MLALPRSVVPWRTSFFHLLNELSFTRHFFGATRIFWIDNGALSRCLFGSQNKILKELGLEDNQIGDDGAASIGDALVYVLSRHPTLSVF